MSNTGTFFDNIVSSLESYRQNMRLKPTSTKVNIPQTNLSDEIKSVSKVRIPQTNLSDEIKNISNEVTNKRYKVRKIHSSIVPSKKPIFENLNEQFNEIKQNQQQVEIDQLKRQKQLEIEQLKTQKQLEIEQLKKQKQLEIEQLKQNNKELNSNYNFLNQQNTEKNNQLKTLLEQTQNKLNKTEEEAKQALSKITELMNEITNLKNLNIQQGGNKIKQKLPFKLQPVKDELYKKVEKYNIKL